MKCKPISLTVSYTLSSLYNYFLTTLSIHYSHYTHYILLQSEAGSLLEGLLPGEEDNLGQDTGVGEVGPGHSHAPPQGPGWRYVSWLPSFSVEQSHTQLPRHQQASAQPATTSQLDSLARQVSQCLVYVPLPCQSFDNIF